MGGDSEQLWADLLCHSALSFCRKWSFDVNKSLKSLEIFIKGPAFFFSCYLVVFFFLVGSTSVVLLDAQEKECSL